MTDWQPIDTAPRDSVAPILAAGPHRRHDPGDKLIVDIIFWSGSWETREVPVSGDLYRKERFKVWEGWRRMGDVGERPIDFDPEFWMPLPEAPRG